MTSTPEQWRKAILKADGIKAGPRLYLTYLAEHMNSKRIVRRPRHLIARDLGVSIRTVDYWNTAAIEGQFLSIVRRGQKGVTAEYEGLMPDVQRASCLRAETHRKLRSEHAETPVQRAKDCAPVVPKATETFGAAVGGSDRHEGTYEKAEDHEVVVDLTACEWHRPFACPTDCRNAERRSA